jgi:outer membrane protein TolC
MNVGTRGALAMALISGVRGLFRWPQLHHADPPDCGGVAGVRQSIGEDQPRGLPALVTSFRDPTLNRLIDIAYHQNLTLMEAGARVIEARATLGQAIGEFYPQTQQLQGSASYT